MGHILLQYKTAETFKGRRNLARQSNRQNPGKKHFRWHFVSRAETEDELRQAGLAMLEADNVGPFSDRVFVLAKKRSCESTQQGLAMEPLPDTGLNQGAT